MKNFLLAGVGGQGTVLASRLIAQGYMDKGFFARTAETIGMAQRGGCVVSHVRIGPEPCAPLIPLGKAELLIGFEPGEAVRCFPFVAPGGTVIVSSRAVAPVTDALAGTYDEGAMLAYLMENATKLVVVDAAQIEVACGLKALNVALLGAAIGAGALDLTLDEMEKTLSSKLKAKFAEMNLRALELGAAMAKGVTSPCR
ncbi:MAG: 2-oxoacid:acceptor oxidoreductase family protein [Clostridia bacterium]